VVQKKQLQVVSSASRLLDQNKPYEHRATHIKKLSPVKGAKALYQDPP